MNELYKEAQAIIKHSELLNNRLSKFGLKVDIRETQDLYFEDEEDEDEEGRAMYEASITDLQDEDVVRDFETITGRYCDIDSVIEEITQIIVQIEKE